MDNDRELKRDEQEEFENLPTEPETLSDRVAQSAPWWGISVGFHVLVLLIAAFMVVSVLADEKNTVLVAGIKPPLIPPEVKHEIDREKTDRPLLETPDFKIDPAEYVAKPSDHNESDNKEKFRQRKGESLDFVSNKPFKGAGTNEAIGGGANSGGSLGGRLGGQEELIRRSGGDGTKEYVLEALKWLARHQNPDGSWGLTGYTAQCGGKRTNQPGKYQGICTPNPGDNDHDAGVTGLALLAFLGAGYFHSSRNTYDGINFGQVVSSGLKWLMDHQDAEGCIGNRKGHSYMYDHHICALALTEAYGLTESALFKEAAQRAVDFTVASQNPGKGWRYKVKSGDNDSSVTGWGVMVLKSAELSHLPFPTEAYQNAKSWFDEVTVDDGYSWVGYYSTQKGKVRIQGLNDQYDNHESMTAVAVMSRIFIDKAKSRPVDQGVRLLVGDLPKAGPATAKDYYYWYYATLALFQYDAPKGPMWSKWNEAMKNALVPTQNKEGDKKGSWEPDDRWGGAGGRVYATAINALTLEIYYRYPSVRLK